jgi:hypothetical protein
MDVQAFDHGTAFDLFVSGEAYEVQLSGERARTLYTLVHTTLHADPLHDRVLITTPELRGIIAGVVAMHVAER